MSLTQQSNDMEKLNWFYRVIKEFGVPVVILLLFVYWLGVRVETTLAALQTDVKLQQSLLQQICINTATDSIARSQCWKY